MRFDFTQSKEFPCYTKLKAYQGKLQDLVLHP